MGFWSAAWYAGSTLSIGLKRSGTPAVMALAAIAVLALLPATRADASFAPATNFGVGTNPGSVAIGNLNGDSFADLVVSNEGSDNVSVLLGNGSGSFGAAASFPVGSSPTSVAIGNLNGDSFADLAVANFQSGNVSVLLGNGAGSFGPATNFATGTFPRGIAIGNLNGDGFADLVFTRAGSDISVLIGDGEIGRASCRERVFSSV